MEKNCDLRRSKTEMVQKCTLGLNVQFCVCLDAPLRPPADTKKSGLDTAATMFLPALEREDLGMLVLAGASALLCFLAGCVVHQSFVLRIILGRIEAIERRVMQVKVTKHRSQSAGSDCGDGQRGVRVQSGCSE